MKLEEKVIEVVNVGVDIELVLKQNPKGDLFIYAGDMEIARINAIPMSDGVHIFENTSGAYNFHDLKNAFDNLEITIGVSARGATKLAGTSGKVSELKEIAWNKKRVQIVRDLQDE